MRSFISSICLLKIIRLKKNFNQEKLTIKIVEYS
jgi:hypothetical protein